MSVLERWWHHWRMKRLCPHPTHMRLCVHRDLRHTLSYGAIYWWCQECDRFFHEVLPVCTETQTPHAIVTNKRSISVRSYSWRLLSRIVRDSVRL